MTNSEWYYLKRSARICIQCGKEDAYTMAGRCLCADCAEKKKEKTKRWWHENGDKMSEHKKLIYRQRKENGLCTVCGRKAVKGKTKCVFCLEKYAEISQEHRLRTGINWPRGDNGLCYRCNKKEALPGMKLCAECYEKKPFVQKMREKELAK